MSPGRVLGKPTCSGGLSGGGAELASQVLQVHRPQPTRGSGIAVSTMADVAHVDVLYGM